LLAYPTDLIEWDRVREKPETKVLSGIHGFVLWCSVRLVGKPTSIFIFSPKSLSNGTIR